MLHNPVPSFPTPFNSIFYDYKKFGAHEARTEYARHYLLVEAAAVCMTQPAGPRCAQPFTIRHWAEHTSKSVKLPANSLGF